MQNVIIFPGLDYGGATVAHKIFSYFHYIHHKYIISKESLHIDEGYLASHVIYTFIIPYNNKNTKLQRFTLYKM